MSIVNRKMKSILILVIGLCLMTLSVVSFLYIRGTIRVVNQAIEAEKSAYKVTQDQMPSQEAAQTETESEKETQQEPGIRQNQETQPKQDPKEMREYHLYGDKVWTVDTVDLYETDEENGKVICQIPAQTELERIGASNKWALVRGEGLQGFVHQADISIVEPDK